MPSNFVLKKLFYLKLKFNSDEFNEKLCQTEDEVIEPKLHLHQCKNKIRAEVQHPNVKVALRFFGILLSVKIPLHIFKPIGLNYLKQMYNNFIHSYNVLRITGLFGSVNIVNMI